MLLHYLDCSIISIIMKKMYYFLTGKFSFLHINSNLNTCFSVNSKLKWFYSTVTNSPSLCRLSWPGDREGYLPLPRGQWVAKRILGNRRPSTREGCEGFWLGNTWGESHTAWSTPEILLIIEIHVHNLINSIFGLFLRISDIIITLYHGFYFLLTIFI